MSHSLRILATAWAVWAVVLGATAGLAAPDDEEPPADAAAAGNLNFNVDESNFDQWIFQGAGNAQQGRERIKTRLKLQIAEVDRVCSLSEPQKQKLALAAGGDSKRFFDEVEEVRKKFLAVKQDQNAFNQIWQDIQPLQKKQAAGLFNDRSLFGKTLRKTLAAEQAAKYDKVLEERRRYRYRASIEVSMTTLETFVALRHEQRDALVQLLVDKTQPPVAFGQYDYYFVMYRLAGLAEKDVKPLLDERQWTLMQAQLNQGRGMKANLVQNGALAE